MLGVRLSEDLDQRLTLLSHKTGRTKTYYVKKALERYLEDEEDLAIAIERIKNPGKMLSVDEMREYLGIPNTVRRKK